MMCDHVSVHARLCDSGTQRATTFSKDLPPKGGYGACMQPALRWQIPGPEGTFDFRATLREAPPPYLLVVGAGNSLDLGRCGTCRRPSGRRSGGGGCQIGEEIGSPPPSPVSFDTNPVSRHENSEMGEGWRRLGLRRAMVHRPP